MKKLTKLITEMDKTGKDIIHVNEAAKIMENSADAAGHIINGCKRFERISKGTYKLLPKVTGTEQTPSGRVHGVNVDKIISFMAKQGKTEIMLGDAAELTTSTINNIYNQMMRDDRLVKTSRGRFGLATEHKQEPVHKSITALIPKPNNDPDELSLDEKMARSKLSGLKADFSSLETGSIEDLKTDDFERARRKNGLKPKKELPEDTLEQQPKPEESILVHKDTPAPEPKDPRAEQHNEKLINAFNEQSGKILTQIKEIARLREENKRLNARLAEKPIKEAYSNTAPQTAQPAPEARDVIRICVCPHCGKADIIVSPAGRIYCNCYKKCNPNPQFEAAWDMLNMLVNYPKMN